MIRTAWGAASQPKTAKPEIVQAPAARGLTRLRLDSDTPGASIGYRLDEEPWRLYTGPINVLPGRRIEAKAIRYGFEESETAGALVEVR